MIKKKVRGAKILSDEELMDNPTFRRVSLRGDLAAILSEARGEPGISIKELSECLAKKLKVEELEELINYLKHEKFKPN